MSKKIIEDLIHSALTKLQENGRLPSVAPSIQVDMTKDKQHGDFASNIALIMAKPAQRNPKELAAEIVQTLPHSPDVKKVEIAGPGFINFFLSDQAIFQVIPTVLEQRERYGHSDLGQGKKIIIEFVSANPNGPLHVGHGRHAAFGAVVANLLEAVGYTVHREYYVNDAGRQMNILASSAWLRYLALFDEKIIFPSNAYKGNYVIDIAKDLAEQHGKQFWVSAIEIFSNLPKDEPEGGDKDIYIDAVVSRAQNLLGKDRFKVVFDFAFHTILRHIQQDLAEFGVTFQTWFSEREFVETGAVDKTIQTLREKNLLYEQEGALWFRSTDFGDEKDRVIQRSNGQRTYFANDLAYHINKFERGFDAAIDIFGADHHGYIPRMQAGLKAYGISPDCLEYLLVQFVTLFRQGQQAQMSTRSGSFVTLRELREEVGNDAARFFYIMRKCEQHIDFDLDLAKSHTNENPVYYIQYAHARICSVLRQLKEKSLSYDETQGLMHLNLLKEQEETQLLTTIGRYPDTILNAARQHEPHLLTQYLRDLATDFHAYYNAHPFLTAEETVRHARMALVNTTRQVFVNALTLIGVSTPESM